MMAHQMEAWRADGVGPTAGQAQQAEQRKRLKDDLGWSSASRDYSLNVIK